MIEIHSMPLLPILCGLTGICLVALYKIISHPLFCIPGPFLARFTRLWLFWEALISRFPFTNVKLHEKYAPNEYSIDDPASAKIIYGSGKGFIKSPWYEASGSPLSLVPGLFFERDPTLHAGIRRKVASGYTMTSLVQMETFVDDCSVILHQRFSEFADSGTTIDLCRWMQCYAFDVIGNITVGERFGFLEQGEDVQSVMASIDEFTKYAVRVGIYAQWHKIIFPLYMRFKKLPGLINVRMFAHSKLENRYAKLLSGDPKADESGPADFITKLIRVQAADPSKINKDEIASACTTNIGAGSDTTSISLSAVFFFLYTYPDTLGRLRNEINERIDQGLLSDPVKYGESTRMPYLQAVIKEALRLHPATGLILGRVVPKGGQNLAGQYFPEGTIVGINSWVAHHNTDIFGSDVDVFRPERWLEESEIVRKRESYFMTFGMGSRMCIGKNISLMEMSKAIPQILRNFDLVPENGTPSWELDNVWFVKPRHFRCRIQKYNRNQTV
ncbi:hypothetical protein N7509_000941 [Penicillium cosmopolitanum]|uniref:Uncharacterized protein n=1 Tax=Penicillium cosmopolitanum TaxID=1131564 RepID=A0A9W9WBX4_9EURO|nr:uncharacterized protein N7509_000941 [Penicillium cosmopolitanum]KAJ5414314.1 hypothetical protein N7509_000941 [Penicillium cosmopolitanum]